MVKSYTDKELLDKVKSLKSFKGIPKDYWLLGVQSKEDNFNSFDDKFYLFKGEKFIMVFTGTTNSGSVGLLNFDTYNTKGVAVIKTNEWYHDIWVRGYHRKKMPAYVQQRPILYYRDSNKNKKVEEIGKLNYGIIGINFHTVSYTHKNNYIRNTIDGWSVGCQVANNVSSYYKVLDLLKNQNILTYCLIKEF